MTTRAWITGILILISGAAGYIAHHMNGSPVADSQWKVNCGTAVVLFEQKRRCGLVDLGELVRVVGTVRRTKIHNDGDFSIDVVPDPEYQRLLYYKDQKRRDFIHVEFMPCERAYVDVERVLQEVARRFQAGETLRVVVTGRWAYDGVDHRGNWREQIKSCLETRDPDPSVGWVELHPAYSVSII